MTPPLQKNTFIALAALAVVVPLAGCSAPASSGAAGTDAGSTDSGSSNTGTDAAVTTGDYTDGEYTETGSYQSPNGAETIEVTLSLADNVVTDVTVVGNGDNPNTKRYQGEFIDGIAEVVVGRNIDEIAVDKVAGSSLTSGGFDDALAKIKADALA